MRILLDHNVPAPLRYVFEGHQVETAFERGWAELTNGELLSAAESSGFDLLITTDQGIRHQQDWSARKLALLVLSTNDWMRIRQYTPLVAAAVTSMRDSSYLEVEIPLPRDIQ
jgi:predicted nuclease of predicted toxin-antitoxin system